jgi:LPXTG-motif cell wall-anchored protein
VTLALAALVVALPVAAVAQDAGSNQYQDPLAGEPGSGDNTSGGNGSSGGSGNSGGNGTNTPASDGGTQNVQPESDGAGTQSAQSGEQLPATGVDAWLIAFTGFGLLMLGVALRLRLSVRPTA